MARASMTGTLRPLEMKIPRWGIVIVVNLKAVPNTRSREGTGNTFRVLKHLLHGACIGVHCNLSVQSLEFEVRAVRHTDTVPICLDVQPLGCQCGCQLLRRERALKLP